MDDERRVPYNANNSFSLVNCLDCYKFFCCNGFISSCVVLYCLWFHFQTVYVRYHMGGLFLVRNAFKLLKRFQVLLTGEGVNPTRENLINIQPLFLAQPYERVYLRLCDWLFPCVLDHLVILVFLRILHFLCTRNRRVNANTNESKRSPNR